MWTRAALPKLTAYALWKPQRFALDCIDGVGLKVVKMSEFLEHLCWEGGRFWRGRAYGSNSGVDAWPLPLVSREGREEVARDECATAGDAPMRWIPTRALTCIHDLRKPAATLGMVLAA